MGIRRGARRLRRGAAGGVALLAFLLAWLLLPGGTLREGGQAPRAGDGAAPLPGPGGLAEPSGPAGASMGLLLGATGEPLPNTALWAAAGAERVRLATDAQGRFPIPRGAGEAAWWSLEAADPGGVLARFLVRGGLEAPVARIAGDRVRLEGTLRDAENGPLEAELLFSGLGGRRALARSRSDAEGRWTVELPSHGARGGLRVRALAAGMLGTWRLEEPPAGPLDLVLRKAALHIDIRPPDALSAAGRLLVAALDGEAPPEVDLPLSGPVSLRLSLGWKELLLLDRMGRPVAYDRIELAGERRAVLAVAPAETGLLAGRIRRPRGEPALDAQAALEPVRLRGAAADLPALESWNPFLAAGAVQPVAVDAEGAFFLPHGPLEIAVLRIQDPATGLARRMRLGLPHPRSLEIALRPLSRLRLTGLEPPPGEGPVWPGRLDWRVLDGEGRLFDGGPIEAIPASLVPLEEGDWSLLLVHESGASTLIPLCARPWEPLGVAAALEPPRQVRVEPVEGRIRLEWYGPGAVALGGETLGAPGVARAPVSARKVVFRDGRGRSEALDLPEGPPALLRPPW